MNLIFGSNISSMPHTMAILPWLRGQPHSQEQHEVVSKYDRIYYTKHSTTNSFLLVHCIMFCIRVYFRLFFAKRA